MKKLLFVLICVMFSCKEQTTAQEIKVLNAIEFKEKIAESNVQLVDVRTVEEYSEGKINNAVNINYYDDSFKTIIAKLDKNKPIAVYCRSGGRSGESAKILKELGFKEIYDLEGGITSWNEKIKEKSSH